MSRTLRPRFQPRASIALALLVGAYAIRVLPQALGGVRAALDDLVGQLREMAGGTRYYVPRP